MTNDLVIEFTHLLYTNKLTVADRWRLLTMFTDLNNQVKKAQNAADRNAELHDIALDDVRYLQDERRELRKLADSQTALLARVGEYLAKQNAHLE